MSPHVFKLGLCCLLLLQTRFLSAQEEKAQPATNALQLPIGRKQSQLLAATRDLIAEQEWSQAAKALQLILDLSSDVFVELERDGRKVFVSARAEAERHLASLPPAGRAEYEKQQGKAAAELLEAAKGKPEALEAVARRFFHTDAGGRAALTLASHYLDGKQPLPAALWFDRLLNRPGTDPTPWALYQATLAFHRSGDLARRDRTWKRLEERAKQAGGIQAGDKFLTMKELRAELDRPVAKAPADWPIFGGSADRVGQSVGGPPLLDPLASWDLFVENGDSKRWTEAVLQEAVRNLAEQRGQPIIPAFSPLAVGDRLVFRTYDAVHAVYHKPHRDLTGRERQPGTTSWYHITGGGLSPAGILAHDKLGSVNQWKALYQQHGPQGVLFENSMLGCLSSDGQRVFLIEDMAMSPHPMVLRNAMFGNMPIFGALRDHVGRNGLKCINLESGKFVWELSGRFNMIPEFQDSFFLGAPLPLAGKLYVLNEKNAELRLVCLECQDDIIMWRTPVVVWNQTLANVRDKLSLDLNRRMHAAHLAYADGIIVCPTHAGAVVAVDLLTHGLLWAYSYREATDPPAAPDNRLRPEPPVPNPEWKSAAPVIVDGKVVFTAPDSSAIHCLNLRDGRLIWKAARATDDLYFAGVHEGKVLVVGKNYLRLCNLADGKELTRVADTGIPTGRGALAGPRYYLPARVGANKEAEVCVIDLAKGQVLSHIKSAKNETVGNLILFQDQAAGQTIDGIRVYPQAKEKE